MHLQAALLVRRHGIGAPKACTWDVTLLHSDIGKIRVTTKDSFFSMLDGTGRERDGCDGTDRDGTDRTDGTGPHGTDRTGRAGRSGPGLGHGTRVCMLTTLSVSVYTPNACIYHISISNIT